MAVAISLFPRGMWIQAGSNVTQTFKSFAVGGGGRFVRPDEFPRDGFFRPRCVRVPRR